MLRGKKILLGITGSIAAYKSAFLVRLLVKAGAEVKVIMTPSSTDFISKLTLSKISNGQCNNLLLAVYLSATCPVIVAPAMDEDMWHHQSTKLNIRKLIDFGNKIIPVSYT